MEQDFFVCWMKAKQKGSNRARLVSRLNPDLARIGAWVVQVWLQQHNMGLFGWAVIPGVVEMRFCLVQWFSGCVWLLVRALTLSEICIVTTCDRTRYKHTRVPRSHSFAHHSQLSPLSSPSRLPFAFPLLPQNRCRRATPPAPMSDNSAAADAMPVRRALQRCSGGPGCPCASHSSSAARSPPSGSPSRSRSASTENTNSGDSVNDSGSYRLTDSEVCADFPLRPPPYGLL